MKAGNGNLISELFATEALLGEDGVINVLQKARQEMISDSCINYVFTTIITSLNITVEEIQKERSQSDLRKIAIGFNWFYLTTIFGYSCSYIHKHLPVKVKQDMIYKYGQLIKKAKLQNPKTDIDKLISQYFTGLEQNFLNYKTNGEK